MNATPSIWITRRYQGRRQLVQFVDNFCSSARHMEDHDICCLGNTPQYCGQQGRGSLPRVRRVQNRPFAKDAGENVWRCSPKQRATRVGEENLEKITSNRGRDNLAYIREDRVKELVAAVFRRGFRAVVIAVCLGDANATKGFSMAVAATGGRPWCISLVTCAIVVGGRAIGRRWVSGALVRHERFWVGQAIKAVQGR